MDAAIQALVEHRPPCRSVRARAMGRRAAVRRRRLLAEPGCRRASVRSQHLPPV